MALYRYLKAEPGLEKKKRARGILSTLLIITGLTFLFNVFYPLVSYWIFVAPRFRKEKIISPLVLGQTKSSFKIYKEIDLTKIRNWFPQAPPKISTPTKITHYTLSIPKLGIFEAKVEIGGEDLKKTLIHYGGTALPGQFGNTVIFGHSVLPQFFNPKNYLTIFSTLPNLEIGDEILVNFDGVEYKYIVEKMAEVEPTDVSILRQHFDDSYLTLVTCVPPGTYWKRLAVKARLVEI